MSSDVGWHIRDKLRPIREHSSIILYVHGSQKTRLDGQPRTATSTLTQLLNYDAARTSCPIILCQGKAFSWRLFWWPRKRNRKILCAFKTRASTSRHLTYFTSNLLDSQLIMQSALALFTSVRWVENFVHHGYTDENRWWMNTDDAHDNVVHGPDTVLNVAVPCHQG